MRPGVASSALALIALLLGCGETPDEEAWNIAAISSPDGSQVAFARSFRYYVNKASAFDPSGWEETVYEAIFVYIMDRSTGELTKLTEAERDSGIFGISWEGDLIAYSRWDVIYVMRPDGSSRRPVFISTGKYGPSLPFTLSGDAQALFYLGMHPEYKLHSIRLDDELRESVDLNLEDLRYRSIHDMIWDSSRDRILLIEASFDGSVPAIWETNPDGTNLRRTDEGLSEYRRRRLGGFEFETPFPELEKMTRDITYEEWGVPAPDEFE